MTTEVKDEVLSFDIMEIMEMIPHRYPFLLVDAITECVPGKYAKGYKNLTMNEVNGPSASASERSNFQQRSDLT